MGMALDWTKNYNRVNHASLRMVLEAAPLRRELAGPCLHRPSSHQGGWYPRQALAGHLWHPHGGCPLAVSSWRSA